jgi:primosomal protein N' (replication factor Y) (superfamily II helicase)
MVARTASQLRLRKETAPLRREVSDSDFPIARILVETGVVHLSEPYDYLVPKEFDDTVVAGTLVEVHFGNRVTQGYVLERIAGETTGLKYIDGVLSSLPLYRGEVRELIERTAHRYAVSPWDVIPAAIPTRTVAVEKRFQGPSTTTFDVRAVSALTHTHQVLIPGADYTTQLLGGMKSAPKSGSVLLVVPDFADVRRLHEQAEQFLGEEVLVFAEDLTKSERYRLFLRAWQSEARIIIGTRSSVFMPLPAGSSIFIYSENEPAMWDKRFPSWNVRDIALLRSTTHSIHFISHSPSLEVLRLSHLGWLREVSQPRGGDWRPRISYESGGKSPEAVMKEALRKGAVLVTVARKGYISAFTCGKCRNIAHCTCGARLGFASAGRIVCGLCSLKYTEWKCDHCGGSQPRALARGGDRIVEELRLSFPNIPIYFSNANRRIDRHKGIGIVVATNGAEPLGRYSAVLLMDGALLFSSIGLRDDEEAKRAWFSAAAMVEPNGEIFISFPSEHPVAQSITRWNVEPIASTELIERNQAGLPPHFRIATITGTLAEIESLRSMLTEIPLFSHISSSTSSKDESTLFLRAPIEQGAEFEEFFATFQRVRSLKGLPRVSVRIDPYSF